MRLGLEHIGKKFVWDKGSSWVELRGFLGNEVLITNEAGESEAGESESAIRWTNGGLWEPYVEDSRKALLETIASLLDYNQEKTESLVEALDKRYQIKGEK